MVRQSPVNALNLSPNASSDLVREMEMGLGFSGRSRVRARGLNTASGLVDGGREIGEPVQAAVNP